MTALMIKIAGDGAEIAEFVGWSSVFEGASSFPNGLRSAAPMASWRALEPRGELLWPPKSKPQSSTGYRALRSEEEAQPTID